MNKLGELFSCNTIQELILRIEKGYIPTVDENVVLQAHFKTCGKGCLNLYNKKVLKIQ